MMYSVIRPAQCVIFGWDFAIIFGRQACTFVSFLVGRGVVSCLRKCNGSTSCRTCAAVHLLTWKSSIMPSCLDLRSGVSSRIELCNDVFSLRDFAMTSSLQCIPVTCELCSHHHVSYHSFQTPPSTLPLVQRTSVSCSPFFLFVLSFSLSRPRFIFCAMQSLEEMDMKFDRRRYCLQFLQPLVRCPSAALCLVLLLCGRVKR